jgi:hypothetical protein
VDWQNIIENAQELIKYEIPIKKYIQNALDLYRNGDRSKELYNSLIGLQQRTSE